MDYWDTQIKMEPFFYVISYTFFLFFLLFYVMKKLHLDICNFCIVTGSIITYYKAQTNIFIACAANF